jgi:hypothetical protein
MRKHKHKHIISTSEFLDAHRFPVGETWVDCCAKMKEEDRRACEVIAHNCIDRYRKKLKKSKRIVILKAQSI